jgi:hypothetical protein
MGEDQGGKSPSAYLVMEDTFVDILTTSFFGVLAFWERFT